MPSLSHDERRAHFDGRSAHRLLAEEENALRDLLREASTLACLLRWEDITPEEAGMTLDEARALKASRKQRLENFLASC